MVANLNGFVSIYEYPDASNKLGGIFHQNQISDIVPSEQELKNTSMKMKIVLILEKRTEQKEGSLGIYLLKWSIRLSTYSPYHPPTLTHHTPITHKIPPTTHYPHSLAMLNTYCLAANATQTL